MDIGSRRFSAIRNKPVAADRRGGMMRPVGP